MTLSEALELPNTLIINNKKISLDGPYYFKRFTTNVYTTSYGKTILMFEITNNIINNTYTLTVRLSDPIISNTIIFKKEENINNINTLQKIIEQTINQLSKPTIITYQDLPRSLQIEYSRHLPKLMTNQLHVQNYTILHDTFRHIPHNNARIVNFNEPIKFTITDNITKTKITLIAKKEDKIGTIRAI